MSHDHECVHELPREQCGHCAPPTPDATPALNDDVTGRPLSRAAFNSRCPGCGEFVLAGELIREAGGRWVCAGCPS